MGELTIHYDPSSILSDSAIFPINYIVEETTIEYTSSVGIREFTFHEGLITAEEYGEGDNYDRGIGPILLEDDNTPIEYSPSLNLAPVGGQCYIKVIKGKFQMLGFNIPERTDAVTVMEHQELTILRIDNFNAEKYGIISLRGLFIRAGIAPNDTLSLQNHMVLSGINDWDVSQIIDMAFTFAGAIIPVENFLSTWDVKNVIDFCGMFLHSKINAPMDLSSWVTSSALTFERMFCISNINDPQYVSGLENWDTSNVLFMNGMFDIDMDYNDDEYDLDPVTFVLNPDVSTWNVEKVVSTERMFANCESFNRDISNWDLKSCRNAEKMFYNATSFNTNLSNSTFMRIPLPALGFVTGTALLTNYISETGNSEEDYIAALFKKQIDYALFPHTYDPTKTVTTETDITDVLLNHDGSRLVCFQKPTYSTILTNRPLYVYDLVGGTYQLNATINISRFSILTSVAISGDGNTICIGEPSRSGSTAEEGVIIYKYDGSTWTETVLPFSLRNPQENVEGLESTFGSLVNDMDITELYPNDDVNFNLTTHGYDICVNYEGTVCAFGYHMYFSSNDVKRNERRFVNRINLDLYNLEEQIIGYNTFNSANKDNMTLPPTGYIAYELADHNFTRNGVAVYSYTEESGWEKLGEDYNTLTDYEPKYMKLSMNSDGTRIVAPYEYKILVFDPYLNTSSYFIQDKIVGQKLDLPLYFKLDSTGTKLFTFDDTVNIYEYSNSQWEITSSYTIDATYNLSLNDSLNSHVYGDRGLVRYGTLEKGVRTIIGYSYRDYVSTTISGDGTTVTFLEYGYGGKKYIEFFYPGGYPPAPFVDYDNIISADTKESEEWLKMPNEGSVTAGILSFYPEQDIEVKFTWGYKNNDTIVELDSNSQRYTGKEIQNNVSITDFSSLIYSPYLKLSFIPSKEPVWAFKKMSISKTSGFCIAKDIAVKNGKFVGHITDSFLNVQSEHQENGVLKMEYSGGVTGSTSNTMLTDPVTNTTSEYATTQNLILKQADQGSGPSVRHAYFPGYAHSHCLADSTGNIVGSTMCPTATSLKFTPTSLFLSSTTAADNQIGKSFSHKLEQAYTEIDTNIILMSLNIDNISSSSATITINIGQEYTLKVSSQTSTNIEFKNGLVVDLLQLKSDIPVYVSGNYLDR